MKGMELKLRPARWTEKQGPKTDATFVYLIRFSDEVQEVSQSEKSSYIDHLQWFRKNYKQYKIIYYKKGNKKINVGFLRKDSSDYIGIALKKEYRGKGFGQEIIKMASGRAIILMNNPRSLHCFVKSGWSVKGFYLEKGE